MSVWADGSYRCDCCGTRLVNGGTWECTVVVELDPDRPGEQRTLHLCHEPREGAPSGCARRWIGPAALAAYYEAKADTP